MKGGNKGRKPRKKIEEKNQGRNRVEGQQWWYALP
jgi:hypothetical protein